MINLLMSSNESEWENSPSFFPKGRCLSEYILPEYKDRYASLDSQSIEFLKSIPCIFAYEKYCEKDARIGKILDISVRQNDVKIDYELTNERIDYETFSGMSQLLDFGTWEMTRTHWTIKNVAFDEVKPYFSTERQFPKVFISYSWTPIRNQETVFELVSKLRNDGIIVIYDKDDLHPGQNINYFMEQALANEDIDNIIVVSNKDYADKANHRQGGVGYEAGIIISEIKSAPLQRRVIPVVVEFDRNGNPYLPTKFQELRYIDLTREDGYAELLSAIKGGRKNESAI